MVEMDASKTGKEVRGRWPRISLDPALCKFFSQVPQKLQSILKSHFNRFDKVEGKGTDELSLRKKQKPSTDWKAELDKQLQLWRENPVWNVQAPEIDVRVPKGSLCNLYVKCHIGLPPDAVFNIVIDPDNRRVFKNVKEVVSRKVLLDDGVRQVVDLEQAAAWRFLWWSGTIAVRVIVDQNREDHSMKFKQVNSGLMKKFEGHWRVEPVFIDEETCFPFKPESLSDYNACTRGRGRIGSRISLDQLLEPAIVPPPPISWYLRGVTTKTTEMLINDLASEADRIKGVLDEDSSKEDPTVEDARDFVTLDDVRDIKERWALRKQSARQSHHLHDQSSKGASGN